MNPSMAIRPCRSSLLLWKPQRGIRLTGIGVPRSVSPAVERAGEAEGEVEESVIAEQPLFLQAFEGGRISDQLLFEAILHARAREGGIGAG